MKRNDRPALVRRLAALGGVVAAKLAANQPKENPIINAIINIPLLDAGKIEINKGAPLMFLESHGMHVRRVSIVRDGPPVLVIYASHQTMEPRIFGRLMHNLSEMERTGLVLVAFPQDDWLPGESGIPLDRCSIYGKATDGEMNAAAADFWRVFRL